MKLPFPPNIRHRYPIRFQKSKSDVEAESPDRCACDEPSSNLACDGPCKKHKVDPSHLVSKIPDFQLGSRGNLGSHVTESRMRNW